MSDEIMMLRDVYMETRVLARSLGELHRSTDIEAIEQARQKVALASWKLWKEIEERVMIEWCNATDTPRSPLHRYSPQNMPEHPKGGRDE